MSFDVTDNDDLENDRGINKTTVDVLCIIHFTAYKKSEYW